MWSPRPSRFPASAALLSCAAALGLLGPGCSQTLQTTYVIQVGGAKDAFTEGVEMSLEFDARELDRKPIVPGRSVSLSTKDIQAMAGQVGAFRVRVFADGGRLVAFGQSPPVEIIKTDVKGGAPNPVINVFVQRPGHFGDLDPLVYPLRNHAAVAVEAAARGSTLRLGAVLLAGGEELAPGPMGTVVERLSNRVQVFNPYNLLVKDLLAIGPGGMQALFRAEAAMFARPDGQILVFGGRARSMSPTAGEPEPTGQLDVFTFFRQGHLDVEWGTKISTPPATEDVARIARIRPTIAEAGAELLLAIGGRDKTGPLDTLVRLQPREPPRLLSLRLEAKRAGHTSTTVPGKDGPEILVLGGNDDGPLAEVIVPPTSSSGEPTLAPVMGQAPPEDMALRREHAAVRLPDGKVLIVAGVTGSPPSIVATNLLYEPAGRRLVPIPLRLATPRAGFAAFAVGEDLVIAGGRDAAGNAVESAEIFDARTFAPVATVKCRGRIGATASQIGNGSVILVGGALVPADSTQPAVPTNAIEIYQPRMVAR